MKRFHWGYFTAINGVITYKESLKKHHYSIKHLRVELELKRTTKKQHRLQAHTHTQALTSLTRQPAFFWKRKQCVTFHGSFSQSNLVDNQEVTYGNTYVFDAGIWPGRFPTNIVVFPEKKQNKTSFPKVPNGMTHPSSWYL